MGSGVTFESLWGRSARVTFESLLGHFNSICVSMLIGKFLMGVGADGVRGIFPFFTFFFVFLRFFVFFLFFFVFLRFSSLFSHSARGQGRTTAIYCKNGEFNSDPRLHRPLCATSRVNQTTRRIKASKRSPDPRTPKPEQSIEEGPKTLEKSENGYSKTVLTLLETFISLASPKNRNRRKTAAFSNRKVQNLKFFFRNRRESLKIAEGIAEKSQRYFLGRAE